VLGGKGAHRVPLRLRASGKRPNEAERHDD